MSWKKANVKALPGSNKEIAAWKEDRRNVIVLYSNKEDGFYHLKLSRPSAFKALKRDRDNLSEDEQNEWEERFSNSYNGVLSEEFEDWLDWLEDKESFRVPFEYGSD